MSDRLKELREKRGKIVNDMRAITDVGYAEKRDLSDEELSKHSTLFDEQRKIGEQIQAEERSIEAARLIADKEEQREERKPDGDKKAAEELRAIAFGNFLRSGSISGEGAEELRAFQAGSSAEGGYLITPEQIVNQLLKNVDDAVVIRQLATKFQVPTADTLGVPTMPTKGEDSDWTTELLTGNEEDTIRFGKRELRPHPVAKRVKLSKTLIRKAPNVESIILGELGRMFGVTEEKAFLTGSGMQQPLGVFTAHADGISTGRDVSTGNTSTSITFDGLISAKFGLKVQYRNSSSIRWLFHPDAVEQICKLKDGDGQYFWQMSVRDGEPDRILNIPFSESEYAPNTFTSGLYVGILGDFSKYWIADATNMQMQRLEELYAETNQVGFIGRMECDGAPVLEEAFVRVKLG